MESQLRELMQNLVGDPPHHVTAQAVRRRVVRRRLFTVIAAATAVALIGTVVPALAGAFSRAGQPGRGATRAPAPPATRTTARVEVRVASCPVPASDYSGTPYSPRPAPATLRLPASLAPPGNAQVFGTKFPPGPASYLLGPKAATCQGELAPADGGEGMTATSVSDRSEGVTMTISPGGLGPSTDLACPYIPAVHAADEAFRQGSALCAHPSADVIRQIPTHTASLYAAAVLIPARVKDPNIRGSGDGTGPTVALYTAWAGPDAAAGQMIACTLAPSKADICAASLRFFLATQAQISTRISAANLTRMQDALSSFLAEHDLR